MNEKVSRHIFELDQSRGQYSEAACDLVRKLLRKDSQLRLQSLVSIKKESFFQTEIENFIDKTLQTEKQQTPKNPDFCTDLNESEKRSIISENFWNPYVIMENYSPLQMLFDEIYSLKQKQQRGLDIPPRKLKVQQIQSNNQNFNSLPPPPLPPPPPEEKKIASFNEPIVNTPYEDDSSTSTLSSQKSDECNLAYKSSYIDDYGEDDDYVRDFSVNDPFTKF